MRKLTELEQTAMANVTTEWQDKFDIGCSRNTVKRLAIMGLLEAKAGNQELLYRLRSRRA